MKTPVPFLCLAAALAGCASVHREIPYTSVTDGPALESRTVPIRIARVEVGNGGLFRPAIYWKPSAWTLLPLPQESFRERVEEMVRRELDRRGFAEEGSKSYSLRVKVEELALFTRGDERTGYRQGYARLHLTLSSSGREVLSLTREGEARFAGSRVRRSEDGTFFRPLHVYELKDPEPSDYAIRLAVRDFLEELRSALPAEGSNQEE